MPRVFILIVILLFAGGAQVAGSAQESLGLKQAKTLYNIVEGEYELVEGPADLCISRGQFELREGGAGIISLFSNEDFFAAHIHKDKVTYVEKGCTSKYSTRAIPNGFENREELRCQERRNSYVRVLKAVFNKGELTYTLKSLRIFKNIKRSRTCKLKLKLKKPPKS